MYTENEKLQSISIEEEMKKSYIDYSMSVIIGRALPDIRDGLKPVHRRILYAMFREGLLSNRKYSKCAGVVGEVLKKYHPHGDTAVYDTLVRLAQPWNMRYPLIDGQGNFGSIDGDSAAAYRYTESKMEKLAEEMLADIDKETVDFMPNFDETVLEPTVLPAKFPNLLINGSSGIAVGMATNIPPHNMTEIINGLFCLIDNPDATIEDLMQHVTGPDFPTGGVICGRGEIKRLYETGKGLIKIRAKAGIEPTKLGKENIIVSEIPYMVNKSSLLEKIAFLTNQKKITGISDLRDESDKDGMRIVIELKRGEIGKVILNQLYKHTQMQNTFGSTLLSIDKGQPKIKNLKEMLEAFLNHRKEVVIRRTRFELRKAEERAHILEGFKIAIQNMDEIVKIIRASKDRSEAFEKLMAKFGLSDRQTNAILDMRLYQLTGLEQDKVEKEYLELIKTIAYLKSILESNQKVLEVIKEELEGILEKYGDERRTDIIESEKDLQIEDLIADEACIITISHTGYLKRNSVNLYRQQKRGGKGVAGMETKEEDYVEHLFTASTHDYLLFFTEKGRVHWLKVWEIPPAGRLSKGKAIVNLLEITSEEKIANVIRVKTFEEDKKLIIATKKGIIKKSSLLAYSNPRKGGIIAINIDDDDSLVSIKQTDGTKDILLATKEGKSIRFHESQVREMGRVTRGVIGIKMQKKDELVAMEVVEDEATLLMLTENGFGKRTEFSQYRAQNRGGQGVITIKTNERNGKVVGGLTVHDHDEMMMITMSGKMVRTPVSGISVIGRNTQGVTLIRLAENDKLTDVTKVMEKDDIEEEEIEKAEGLEKDIEKEKKEKKQEKQKNEEDSEQEVAEETEVEEEIKAEEEDETNE